MAALAQQLSTRLGTAFAAHDLPEYLGQVQGSDRPDLAPFQCNGALAAAKLAKKSPRDIAALIATDLESDPLIASTSIAGPGFLNITPSDAAYEDQANALMADLRTGAAKSPAPEKLVIDFGGPNVAKPMHVGHLRSSVIGDALQRLGRFVGHEVISDIHLGDWGLQMGHLITQLQDEQPELCYFDKDFAGLWPDEPPVNIDDLSRLYPEAAAAAKADKARMKRSRKATAELQAGREGYLVLLRHFIAVSRTALEHDFNALGVHFDLWKGESDVNHLIPSMIDDFKARGVTEKSQGALIIRVARADDKKEQPPLILVSSEGSALYGTTDLATIVDRNQNISPDRTLYVVDQRQSQHFEQVFRAADKAGLMAEDRLEHIGFGTVNGKDGKPFKTREGGVMRLSDLMKMARSAARARMDEAGIGQDMDEAARSDVARMVGLAAIKFADLRNQRLTNYVFDMDRFTAFEGKTGPYLLYAAVRIKSILRKAVGKGLAGGKILPKSAEEKALVLALDGFDSAVHGAWAKRAPHILCEHVFELAQAFSRFYAACPILPEKDDAIRASRLSLAALTLRQLETALGLLGLDTPERM
ncbi:MAG: arginine--tRNA ligase [Robiginitomaculum sp.]|nr:MAG: arginine--tRNA ligase [Robiginitomaculum sp.]